MKIYSTLLFFLIPLFIQSQWRYEQKTNKFDGKYRYASVVGTGGEYPFNKPVLAINNFEGSNDPNFYITNIGYTGCDKSTLEFAFDNYDEVLEFDSTTNNENDAAFISYKYSDRSNLLTLLNLLKSKSKVYVRYSSTCSTNDYSFGLGGSTKALEFVLGNFLSKLEEEMKIIEEREIRLKERREKERLEAIAFSNEEQRKKREIEILDSTLMVSTFDEKMELLNKLYSNQEEELIEIGKELDYAFSEEGKKQEVIVHSFKLTKTTKATFCIRFSLELKNSNKNSDRYYGTDISMQVINKELDGCIRVHEFRYRKRSANSFFNKENLLILNHDIKTWYLVKNWDKYISH